MFDAAFLRNDLAPTFRQMNSSALGCARAGVGVVPCALVYVETDSAGSPNCKSADPFCYVEQAITLNRSMNAVGLPRLTVATNVADDVARYLEKVDADARPYVLQLAPSKLTLPRNTRFYGAHFRNCCSAVRRQVWAHLTFPTRSSRHMATVVSSTILKR